MIWLLTFIKGRTRLVRLTAGITGLVLLVEMVPALQVVPLTGDLLALD